MHRFSRFILDVVLRNDGRDRFMRKFKKPTGCKGLDEINAMICEAYGQRTRHEGGRGSSCE